LQGKAVDYIAEHRAGWAKLDQREPDDYTGAIEVAR
jgi:hypothetical protein